MQVRDIKGVGPKKVQVLQQAGYIIGSATDSTLRLSDADVLSENLPKAARGAPEECTEGPPEPTTSLRVPERNWDMNGVISHRIDDLASPETSCKDLPECSDASEAEDTCMVIRNINIATAEDLASGAMRLGKTVRIDIFQTVLHCFIFA